MCGKSLGGIWVDGANGSKTYIPVKCNSKHLFVEVDDTPQSHYYFDKESGGSIFFAINPKVTVDERGCIRGAKQQMRYPSRHAPGPILGQ